jgi:hypothetical protein
MPDDATPGTAGLPTGAVAANSRKFYWGRAIIGGVLAELCLFAIVFPALYLIGQRAFLTSIVIGSAVLPFLFALWACKPAKSHFLWHGLLVGVAAALFYLIIAHGQPEPLLYKIAHGLKLVGGVVGGLVASLRKRAYRLKSLGPITFSVL